ncbi:metalloendopeptidase [Aeromicrobium sp. PE09-221]|uniref:M23 family metallopeptidase n=1 Tax=Aeromicrobium sp. PE09-221 TaxID=1898043 RepID=UPI000B3E5727|nr:M23 family metallopeptidase [Aeromicrobium sp. PE09-221]OUZ11069.1 metalloendopeptidase [Aeromicrobium sp. PE09-221]
MRVLLASALISVLFGPAAVLLSVGLLVNPAAQASCMTGESTLRVGPVPDHLDTKTADGTRVRLNRQQLTHAATIVQVGSRLDGVGRDGITIALMAALTESGLRMLANSIVHPGSRSFPNDGDGGDHDSLGLFQMRPSSGWGRVPELMDPTYQARAFFGGPSGPNHGSPRGLLDIRGWESMSKSAAAQAVEVSRYPDRYATWEPVATRIIDTLTGASRATASEPESSRVVFPLPRGTWVRTSGFGMRRHPVTGQYKLHTGADYATAAGTAILAAADGRVTFAGPATGYGNLIMIEHTVGGRRVATGYAHMYADGIHVRVGDRVTAGERIADVGVAGYSTGAHLHFEVRPGGADAAPSDPEPWLAAGGASELETNPTETGARCGPPTDDAESFAGADPGQLVDDPTTSGRITARAAHVLTQIEQRFPTSSWACWRPGNPDDNDHSAGRACDGTFGNSIGTRATGAALNAGWTTTNWLKANAEQLGVEYLIWQGRIWSVRRAAEGWRPYDGGGTFDPRSVTGGHYDHLHVTVS